MKILGIGNAIVDVICKVDEDFINKRMILANSQREHSAEYDYYIENQDLNTAVNNIIDIICKLEEQ